MQSYSTSTSKEKWRWKRRGWITYSSLIIKIRWNGIRKSLSLSSGSYFLTNERKRQINIYTFLLHSKCPGWTTFLVCLFFGLWITPWRRISLKKIMVRKVMKNNFLLRGHWQQKLETDCSPKFWMFYEGIKMSKGIERLYMWVNNNLTRRAKPQKYETEKGAKLPWDQQQEGKNARNVWCWPRINFEMILLRENCCAGQKHITHRDKKN